MARSERSNRPARRLRAREAPEVSAGVQVNLKAAVLHADWFDPELNPKLASFAAHYDTLILPTQPGVPPANTLTLANMREHRRPRHGAAGFPPNPAKE